MRIILFTDCLGAGGAQRQLVGLAVMLKEKGFDVKVATYFDIDFYKHYLDEANVPNELIPGADNQERSSGYGNCLSGNTFACGKFCKGSWLQVQSYC